MENMDLIFKALSDPIRLQILKELYSTDMICVCHLVDIFDLSQSKLSYHLKFLLSLDLIHKTSEGKWNYYSVNKNLIAQILTPEVINKLFLSAN